MHSPRSWWGARAVSVLRLAVAKPPATKSAKICSPWPRISQKFGAVIISCGWLQSCTRCSEFVDARGSILMNCFVWIFRFGLVKAFSEFFIVISRFPVLFVIRPFVIRPFVIRPFVIPPFVIPPFVIPPFVIRRFVIGLATLLFCFHSLLCWILSLEYYVLTVLFNLNNYIIM